MVGRQLEHINLQERPGTKELVGRFGLNSDFVPENQDKGASLLIPSKAKDYLSSNNLNGALNLTNNLWSSLPGGRHSKIDFKGFLKFLMNTGEMKCLEYQLLQHQLEN